MKTKNLFNKVKLENKIYVENKFLSNVDLEDSNIRDIADFVRKYEKHSNIKVDVNPITVNYIKNEFK